MDNNKYVTHEDIDAYTFLTILATVGLLVFIALIVAAVHAPIITQSFM